MLFIISDELVVDDVVDAALYISIRRAIKHIATAVFESKHLLFGSMKVLSHFERVFQDDQDLHKLFHSILLNFYTTNLDFIKRRIEIVLDVVASYRIESNIEYFQIPIINLQDSSNCQKTLILGEDFSDCDFYEVVLNWFVKKNVPVNIAFEKDNGGGSTLINTIKNHLSRNKICLALVDTDRKYPSGPTGATYNDCKFLEGKKIGLFKLIVLDVQEIENLVPFNFLDNKTYSSDYLFKKQKFDLIRENGPELLPFFDIKDGIVKQKIGDDDDYLEYAKACCKCDPSITDFNKHYASLNDKDHVYPPLSRILKLVKNDLKDRLDKMELLEYQENEWNRIGLELMYFTCARNREALN